VTEFPLFPLPETVVFPGMTLPLFIFEERYKRMVRECVEANQRRIVIVLAKPQANLSDGGPGPSIYEVGSFVDILSVSENPDGTFNILTHGQGRCRAQVSRSQPVKEADGTIRYLHYSKNRPYPLGRDDPNLERVAAWDALDTFREYAQTFFAFDALKQIEESLPEDLLYQASFVCANVRVPAEERQRMLEAPSLVARFETAQQLMWERLSVHRKKASGA